MAGPRSQPLDSCFFESRRLLMEAWRQRLHNQESGAANENTHAVSAMCSAMQPQTRRNRAHDVIALRSAVEPQKRTKSGKTRTSADAVSMLCGGTAIEKGTAHMF